MIHHVHFKYVLTAVKMAASTCRKRKWVVLSLENIGHCTWTSTKDCKETDLCTNRKRLLQLENEIGRMRKEISFLIQTSWMRKPSWSTISTAVAMPFHPEIPFWPEPYWELLVPGQAKRHTSTYCNYCITGLMKTIPKALDNVSLQNIQNYFQCVRDYMYGYLLGHQAGIQLEELVKTSLSNFKSHRHVAEEQWIVRLSKLHLLAFFRNLFCSFVQYCFYFLILSSFNLCGNTYISHETCRNSSTPPTDMINAL